MSTLHHPLYHVWDYRPVDLTFWQEHLADWLPEKIIDAHTHVADPRLRREPLTDEMRRQYWVNEVFEPIDAPTARRCYETVFHRRLERCVAFGIPDLAFDLDGGNDYLIAQNQTLGWHSLVLLDPHWSPERVAAELQRPTVIGLKPYYALLGHDPSTRDAHLEASIFEFLPHRLLEVADQYRAWITLHVPKAARLGHPDNLREVRELRRRYPRITLVIAHLGRCYTEPHAREALPALAEDPELYFDTSAVLNPDSHRVALECLGPRRLLYGSDCPIMYLRGRRQYQGRSYVNRTDYPFYFNREREAPEVEARYTLYLYEDLRAIRQACEQLGITTRADIRALFHDNAAALIERIRRERSQLRSAT
jgi:uncharacterized protein